MKLRYFVDKKEVTYLEWAAWYENYKKAEKEKFMNWLKKGLK